MMKKEKVGRSFGRNSALVMIIIWLLWVALMYYLLLPALNVHSAGLWMFAVFICALPIGILCLIHRLLMVVSRRAYESNGKGVQISFGIAGVLLLMFFLLLFFGSEMFHASSYSSILKTEDYDFTDDLDQSTAVSKIALMDTDSAVLLGNREIGSLSDVVSQFDVSDEYTQIDLDGSPVKVSALDYAGFFKYIGNKKNGIPGYVKVDPVGQSAEYVQLKQNMNYVPSAYFAKDLRRHLRFTYPTKIFGNLHFEIDEDGNPYYVASVVDYKIGVFGGESVKGAIICNPVDGTCQYFAVADIPTWVDDVFDGNLLVEQYNWYGKLSNGFLNSIFGKKGCKKCTETIQSDSKSDSSKDDSSDDSDGDSYAPDYGYVAKDGDIWIYTGVTSVNDDASNIGFILVNERTSEAHYFKIAGADESSAMSAAEGEVQEKGYQASFPSLINVDNQPTYIMVLKDASGIVKLYAMVNVEAYNKVTTATSLEECFAKYRKLIGSSTGEADSSQEADDIDTENGDVAAVTESHTFGVADIRYVDIDGNTYVYLTGDDGNLYKMKFADDESLIYLKTGDQVAAECVTSDGKAFQIKDFTVSENGNSSGKAESGTEEVRETEIP